MTRRDYERFAYTIKQERYAEAPTFNSLVRALMVMFQEENRRFNKAKFLIASYNMDVDEEMCACVNEHAVVRKLDWLRSTTGAPSARAQVEDSLDKDAEWLRSLR